MLAQQNLVAAENVPPPPPLPSANKSITKQERAPAPIPVPEVGQSGKSVTTAPGKKNKTHLTTEITIIPKKSETRAEYRAGGILYMIKITPRGGRPFYLIDHQGDGIFVRSDLAQIDVIPTWLSEQF